MFSFVGLSQYNVYECEYYSEKERRTEPFHFKPRHDCCSEHDERRINHDGEETECEDVHRKRQDDEQWLDEEVKKPKHRCSTKRREQTNARARNHE